MNDNSFFSSNSFDMSSGSRPFEEEEKENKADSGDELDLISTKYDKIYFLKDSDTEVIESIAVIKYVDKIKYYNDYKLIKELGRGSICKVKLVEKNNVKYALKIVNERLLLKHKQFAFNEDNEMSLTNPLEGILKEIAILKKVENKNLVKLYEIMYNKKKQKKYLVLEYCENGDLMEYDDDKEKFIVNKNIFQKYLKNIKNPTDIEQLYYSENQIRKFIRQIIRGLNYLHRLGIIHGDIKPNNILLDKKNECKIIDFNFSSILDRHQPNKIKEKIDCNDYFRPPELCELNLDVKKSYNFQRKPIDIWAIGVTAFILSYKKFPFYDENGDIFALYEKINKGKYEIPENPKRSNDFLYFLKKCLEKDPNRRITSEKILNLKWLNLGKKENLKNQCKKAVKFVPSKEEIFKQKAIFSTNYDDIKKLKNDESDIVKNFSNKILQKMPKVKDGKKVKIKIKIKNNNK